MEREQLKNAAAQVAALFVTGCSSSPAQNMFGSFFPAWMLCAAAGVIGAVILGRLLSALGVGRYLIAPPLTYLCFAVSGTLLIWLLWFGN